MDIAIESYGNRKVGLVCRRAGGQMLIPVVFEQERPFSDNEPHSDNATDPTANNGKGRAKQLSHHPGLDLSQLWSALEENLVDARHPAADMVGRLQLSDGVADDRA